MKRHGPEETPEEEPPLFAYARRTDPGTSHAAGVSLDAASVTRLEGVVLRACATAGAGGMTTLELEVATGLPRVTVSPRIKPLVEKRLLEDSGFRRPGPSGRLSIAWRALNIPQDDE